jgi:hypothetical protein
MKSAVGWGLGSGCATLVDTWMTEWEGMETEKENETEFYFRNYLITYQMWIVRDCSLIVINFLGRPINYSSFIVDQNCKQAITTIDTCAE